MKGIVRGEKKGKTGRGKPSSRAFADGMVSDGIRDRRNENGGRDGPPLPITPAYITPHAHRISLWVQRGHDTGPAHARRFVDTSAAL